MAIPPLAYRTVFVSDVHLGSAASKVEEFSEFLHSFQCENLYLVGDLIEVWVIIKSGKWRQEHTNVIRTLLGKSKRGCSIFYTPGNHDTFLRRMNGADLAAIKVDEKFIHTTANGQKLLVTHGDQYDPAVKSFALAFLGTWLYEIITVVQLAIGRLTKKEATQSRLKKGFKKIIQTMGNWETKLVVAAQNEGCDGVICGHIHRPALKVIDETLYGNTGDWVENCTVIVEHFDGRLELLTWQQMRQDAQDAPKLEVAAQPHGASEVR